MLKLLVPFLVIYRETQSLTGVRKNSLLPGRNLKQDRAHEKEQGRRPDTYVIHASSSAVFCFPEYSGLKPEGGGVLWGPAGHADTSLCVRRDR